MNADQEQFLQAIRDLFVIPARGPKARTRPATRPRKAPRRLTESARRR